MKPHAIKNPGSHQRLRRKTRKAHPSLGRCQRCGKPAQVRHHRNAKLEDVRSSNVLKLCRSCHNRLDPKIKTR